MFTQFKSLGLVSVMALSFFGASAATITVDGITYSTSGNKATVAKASYTGELYIPAKVTDDKGTTYDVTGIAATAFKSNAKITKIEFAKECVFASLPRGAFQDCSGLQTLILPESIGKFTQDTFRGCSVLEELTIPGNVPSMQANDLQGCVGLKKLIFAPGEASIDVSNKMWGTTLKASGKEDAEVVALEEIEINRVLTSTATGSADLPFNTVKSLKKVTYADNLTEIPTYYFQNCSGLSDVHLPASLEKIGDQAFQGTALAEVVIPAGVTSIGSTVFSGCKNLKKVVLGDAVTSIGDLAFNGAPVSDINFPATLTSIGIRSFYGSNLSGAVVLPDAITRIGEMAFAENKNMTEITLPASIAKIGAAPFKGNVALAKINLAANEAFKIDAAGALVSADEALLVAYPAAATAEDYTGTATELGAYAFYGAKNLKTVNLPNVAVFGDYSLAKTGLEAATISGAIGRNVLTDCVNLKSVVVAGGEVPFGICSGCSALESYTATGEITIVRQEAFKNCSALKSLNLGKILVIIEADAFAGADGLNIIVGTNNPPALAADVFTPGCKISATVPADLVAAYKAANQWSNLEIIGDANLAIGGLDLGMPNGLYYAGEDGNLHCVYADGNTDTYDVGGMPHTFQLLQFKSRIYGASAGVKFVYSGTAGTEGDGKLFYISRVDNHLFQATLLDNAGNNAYMDPFALYSYGDYLYVNDRNVCLRKIPADAIALPQNYPSFMENNWMAGYANDFVYGCIKAGFSITKDQDEAGNPEPLYWIGFKYNGNGILRFKEKHIGSSAAAGPETGLPHIFKGAAPIFTTFCIDEPNRHMYIYVETETANAAKEGALKAGIYRFNLDEVIATPNPGMMADLNPILIDGSPVKYEGAGANEHVGISQLAIDENGEYLYWCYRAPTEKDVELAGTEDGVKAGHYAWAQEFDASNPLHHSGIKRIKLGQDAPEVEMVAEGVNGYGVVPVNYEGSKKPSDGIQKVTVAEKAAYNRIVVAGNSFTLTDAAKVNVYNAAGAQVSGFNSAADAINTVDGNGVYFVEAIFADGAKQVVKIAVK